MSEILEQIHLWLEQIIITLGYTGIMVVMFLESLFPPIPSELLMPFAGSLASQGHFSFSGILLAGTAGSLLGALTLYYLGQYVGEPLLRTFIRRYGHYLLVAERDLNRSLDLFEQYSASIVFFGRFIPLIRSLISVPAGMNRMPLGRFVFFTALGSGLWNGLMSYIGVILGENWAELLIFVKQYEILVVATLVALILFFVLKRAPQFIAFQSKSEDTE
ncbi:MAG: DedA family protein [Anaerolineae bacterium]|nr:DedA family protein [Anaerolineae bacterium]